MVLNPLINDWRQADISVKPIVEGLLPFESGVLIAPEICRKLIRVKRERGLVLGAKDDIPTPTKSIAEFHHAIWAVHHSAVRLG